MVAILEKQNISNWHPIDYNVLIKLEKAESVSEGGIVMVEETVNREQWAKTKAVIVGMGAKAFHDSLPEQVGDERRKPQIGDHVTIKEYSSQRLTGDDGNFYCLVCDKDILAVYSE